MGVELRATYRVQVNAGFTLEDAARISGYLSKLGISHLYTSPILQAVDGSTHGYDVVNHHLVNEELGGEQARARLAAALQAQHMGLVVDIVPNHMAILGSRNPWWWDVLQNGQASPYASYFDVDWDPPEARHSNEVLVPVLADHYGRVLERGDIRLEHAQGVFTIHYFNHIFPVDPRSISSLLASAAERANSPRLAFLAGAYDQLPGATATDRTSAQRRSRDQRVLDGLLREEVEANGEIAAAINAVVSEVNRDVDSLDVLLSLQNYRLAFWRISQRELGYRRFFDIVSLIGLRMEDEQVYTDTHRLVLEWVRDGSVTGLRVDHPDGLRDPQGYFERLRRDAPETWIVIEKIVEEGEEIPAAWPVDGTVGYEFLNWVNGLFVDPGGEERMSAFYQAFTGVSQSFHALMLAGKRVAAREVLGSDLGRLADLLLRICERHRRYRDYSRKELSRALVELATCLPVYRTYLRAGEAPLARDRAYIEAACQSARENQPDLDPELFDFLRDLLLEDGAGDLEMEFVMAFQQFSGPVMAKGVEDTAYYGYHRLISLNEVGGNPGRFGTSVADFHREMAETQARWPKMMLATSTHDTKRSEDVRARINLLSEIPDQWASAVQRWAQINARYRSDEQPDRNDEYLFYQTLLGAWPIEPERMLCYMEKAVREARRHGSWTNPDADYENAVADFVRGAMEDTNFRANFEAFTHRLVEPGRINALAQTLIKLTAPGVPDLYQGTEIWAHSLVDPDNRRPVDYAGRERALEALRGGISPEEMLARSEEGLPKMWVIYRTLQFRGEHPQFFSRDASYQPLEVRGECALAFLRGQAAATIVPRLVMRSRQAWRDTTVTLPEGEWKNELTGDALSGGEVKLDEILARFPVALLALQTDRTPAHPRARKPYN